MNNQINKKIELNVFIGYIILIAVAGITTTLSFFIIKTIQAPTPEIIEIEKEKIIEREVLIEVESKPKPSDYPDYDVIKGENPDLNIKSVIITEDCPENGCVNHNPATIDFGSIVKNYKVKGEFVRAYLYIEAFVDYKRPLTVWDDFYFKINNLGGHLVSNGNLLPVPPGDSSRYLYDLRSISYYSSISDKQDVESKEINKNIFNLLLDGNIIYIVASISSNRPGRIMNEVAIYYECFKDSNCSIDKLK